MTASALVIYILFALLSLVGRGWLQYRRTGDYGYRGLSGRTGSLEWFGGLLLTLGAMAALVAPVTELSVDVSGFRFFLPASVRLAGLALMLLGVALTLVAQLEMGSSWRVGVDSTETTELVTTGLFRWVRNPIFAGTLAVFVGLVLAVPNVIAAVALAAALAGIEIHVREVEEPYLIRIHGDRYRSYAQRVGRFVPGLGRIK